MKKDNNQDIELPKVANLESVTAIPLRDNVLFPGMTGSIAIHNPDLLSQLEKLYQENEPVFACSLRDPDAEGLLRKDFYPIGVLCVIKEFAKPDKDAPTCVIVYAIAEAEIRSTQRMDGYINFRIQLLARPPISMQPQCYNEGYDREFKNLKEQYEKLICSLDESGQMKQVLDSIGKREHQISFMCLNSPLSVDQKMSLLKEMSPFGRVLRLMMLLDEAKDYVEIRKDMAERTHGRLTRQQRDQFLRAQIQTMQEELGDTDDAEVDELVARADAMKWPEEVDRKFTQELRRMERFNPTTPEYGILFGYLETLLDLPWDNVTKGRFKLEDVKRRLDEDHYGLKDVKERIVEHMAVQMLRGDMKAPILCLYGPPGVGKTSIGKSIANAMHREYTRISLGGLHDEAEIRGHRKTYIGAMPGRIIAGLKKKKGSNVVFVLDEIDKLSQDIKGDPASALLEVLDPEQNSKFHDNYLDVDYDLSKVMFIATANDLSTISRPLLDRMELVEVTGYLLEEKIEIARRHLIPKVMEKNGLGTVKLKFTDEALRKVIENYTRESGVRGLEKALSRIMRKIAVKVATGGKCPETITPEFVREALGLETSEPDIYEGNDYAGVVTGLAWTSVGGEILYVESSLSPGKGEKTVITGNLGTVMKESAALALQYVKAHAHQLGIDREMFAKYDVHIHFPEGAVPKDGPSAGITIATSLASVFTRRKVRRNIAMTGEITLRGKVLPVGGIKEKILAAKRSGINEIILSSKNRKNIEDIAPEYIEGMKFSYVETVGDVLSLALTDEKDLSLEEPATN